MNDNHPYDPVFDRVIEEATENLMVSVPYNALIELLNEIADLKARKPMSYSDLNRMHEERRDAQAARHEEPKPKADGRRGPRPMRRGNTEEGAFCAVLADGGSFTEALEQTDWSEGKGRGKAAVFATNIKEMRKMTPDQRRAHLREYFGWGIAGVAA